MHPACHPRRLLGLALALLILSACGARSASQPNARPATSPPPAAAFDDPFAYCAAVGTADTPDARYTGDPMPEAVVQGMVRKGIVTADAPPEFQRSAVWRCMGGNVWACHFGANLPCQEKADTSRTPTAAVDEFCAANPAADSVPAAVTGRATVYAWGCKGGKPAVLAQSFTADPQGYLAEFWYELAP